jgi:hypothetical protein
MPNLEHRTIKGVGLHHKPLSLAHIKDITPWSSHLANFLKPFASEDVYYRKWEFDGGSILDDFWTFTEDATATGFAPASPQTLGGSLVGSTGTTDEGALSMLGQTVVKGDGRAFVHVHFSLDEVTAVQFEIGLVDAVTDKTLPVISDVDTPANGSNGAGDIAVVHMDTSQTLTTMALVADGSTSGMDCQKVNIGTLSPTAATEMCVRVVVDVNSVACMINNQRQYYKSLGPNAIEGGTLLAPWIFFRCKSGSDAKAPSIHMVELMGEK